MKDNELKVVIGVMRAANLFNSNLKKTLKDYDINVSEFSVLEFLYNKGPNSIEKIREKVLVSSGSMTYITDNLKKKGYLTKANFDEDRRVCSLMITEKTRKLFDDLFPYHIEKTKELFKGLTEEEILILSSLLKKIKE